MKPSTLLLPILLLAGCTIAVGGGANYEMVEEPVEFWFDADPRDRTRVANVAENLEPYFPDMSWRIDTYEPRGGDGLAVQVEERLRRDLARPDCENCMRSVTVFTIYENGSRVASEEYEDCSIFSPEGDCFALRELVSLIRNRHGNEK